MSRALRSSLLASPVGGVALAVVLTARLTGAQPVGVPPPASSAPAIAASTVLPAASVGAPATADAAANGAAQPTGAPSTDHTIEEHAVPFTASRDVTRTKYWAQGPTRWFLSTAVDVGYLYLRPRASVGYGHPFWTWIGLDANPQVSNNWAGAYGGLRAALPFVDLRLGGRYAYAFRRSFLAPKDKFERLDLEGRDYARSSYFTLEAEVSGGVPFGPGSVLMVGSVSQVHGVPEGLYVFEETLRLVVKPSNVWRGRLGYAVRLGVEGKVSVGLVGEVLKSNGREQVIRAGLIASAVLSNHLEVLGSFVPPILSPDTRTTAGGDFGQLGLRYRWATGTSAEPMVVPLQ